MPVCLSVCLSVSRCPAHSANSLVVLQTEHVFNGLRHRGARGYSEQACAAHRALTRWLGRAAESRHIEANVPQLARVHDERLPSTLLPGDEREPLRVICSAVEVSSDEDGEVALLEAAALKLSPLFKGDGRAVPVHDGRALPVSVAELAYREVARAEMDSLLIRPQLAHLHGGKLAHAARPSRLHLRLYLGPQTCVKGGVGSQRAQSASSNERQLRPNGWSARGHSQLRVVGGRYTGARAGHSLSARFCGCRSQRQQVIRAPSNCVSPARTQPVMLCRPRSAAPV
ncbi:hypothetical protein T492DRAFT_378504 [Pavlovales sp. CCMP2436]|nr:hypothetical protein T492DRAFT_378504 [Pavlovales sp. CCMP2436]